jgi:hypothetical protein
MADVDELGEVGADGDKLSPPPESPSSITDRESFDRETSGDRAVAGLLFYKELDCLIDLAHSISLDFFDRPQLYREVTDDVVRDLAQLRARYGNQEDFLSREQRYEIFAGIFGEGGETGGPLSAYAPPAEESYPVLRDQVLAAAAAFAERVFDTSEDILRRAVRFMHVYLKDYLVDLTGASVAWSRTVGFPAITELSYRILRDQQIAARFGVNRQPGPEWPVVVDANGSKLVEQISGTPMRVEIQRISRGTFNDKQQLALRGAEALAAVMDYDGRTDSASLDVLISRCYTWYVARGRVLQLPVAVRPPSRPAIDATDSSMSGSTPSVSAPAIELQPVNGYGNRSMFGTAVPEMR